MRSRSTRIVVKETGKRTPLTAPAGSPGREPGRLGETAFILLLLLLLLPLSACKKSEEVRVMGKKLERLEIEFAEDGSVSKEREQELKAQIRKLLDDALKVVDAIDELGTYYRMIASELLDREMFGPALEYYVKAMEINTGNYILPYYAGVCSGKLLKAAPDEAQRQRLLRDAERFYLQAISLKPTYIDALYALSVLYLFESDTPLSAAEYVDAILAREPGNVQALFLKGRVEILAGNYEEAVEAYDRIIEVSKDEATREKARANRAAVLEGAYER
jgi:tetratricopeptide (TPR) repeat protein